MPAKIRLGGSNQRRPGPRRRSRRGREWGRRWNPSTRRWGSAGRTGVSQCWTRRAEGRCWRGDSELACPDELRRQRPAIRGCVHGAGGSADGGRLTWHAAAKLKHSFAGRAPRSACRPSRILLRKLPLQLPPRLELLGARPCRQRYGRYWLVRGAKVTVGRDGAPFLRGWSPRNLTHMMTARLGAP